MNLRARQIPWTKKRWVLGSRRLALERVWFRRLFDMEYLPRALTQSETVILNPISRTQVYTLLVPPDYSFPTTIISTSWMVTKAGNGICFPCSEPDSNIANTARRPQLPRPRNILSSTKSMRSRLPRRKHLTPVIPCIASSADLL